MYCLRYAMQTKKIQNVSLFLWAHYRSDRPEIEKNVICFSCIILLLSSVKYTLRTNKLLFVKFLGQEYKYNV